MTDCILWQVERVDFLQLMLDAEHNPTEVVDDTIASSPNRYLSQHSKRPYYKKLTLEVSNYIS